MVEQPQTMTLSVRILMMTSSRRLFIDLETSSSTDLSKAGVYRYAESEDFQILLFAFSFDGDPVDVIDMEAL